MSAKLAPTKNMSVDRMTNGSANFRSCGSSPGAMKAQTCKRSTGRTRNAPAMSATFMLTQNGSVGSRNTSLTGSIGWASQVMIRSEKLKVAMKPMPSAITATMIRCRSSPRWARKGMRPSSTSCGVAPGGRAFRKSITRPRRRRRRLARVHHERDLAADARGGERRPQAPRRPPAELLELLGQLAGHHHLAPRRTPPRSPRGWPGCGGATRRARPVVSSSRRAAQPVEPPARLHRQEALEDEAVGRHARRRQRRRRRRKGPGPAPPAPRRHGPRAPAGSRDPRCPGVPASVTRATDCAVPEPPQELAGPRVSLLCSK